MKIATKQKEKKEAPKENFDYQISQAFKASLKFAEEAKKNWL